MEIKFGGNWYKVVETREVAGLTYYAIEDEPHHIDWITNPKGIRYDDEINSCPEFPFFGATYPDARCIDGNLYDLDDCDVFVDEREINRTVGNVLKWADKTMIEKATQWLFENVYDYLNPEDQERVESFRKYLEE